MRVVTKKELDKIYAADQDLPPGPPLLYDKQKRPGYDYYAAFNEEENQFYFWNQSTNPNTMGFEESKFDADFTKKGRHGRHTVEAKPFHTEKRFKI